MTTYILTSMFKKGFDHTFSQRLNKCMAQRNSFAFVASEFESDYKKNDRYFNHWLSMFEDIGIFFENAFCIDGRMTSKQAQNVINTSDVIWLSGGDTPKQFEYLKKYGIDKTIKDYNGVIIGMSAGSINLGKTSICSLTSGRYVQEVYEGLGCVDISIEPHFSTDRSEEILELSKKYKIYGITDESAIVISENKMEFFGDVYLICDNQIKKL